MMKIALVIQIKCFPVDPEVRFVVDPGTAVFLRELMREIQLYRLRPGTTYSVYGYMHRASGISGALSC